MKIKHILTLFCVTLTLAFLLVSCADDSSGTAEYTGPFEASNVSARQCTSSLSTLNCFISVWNTENSGGGASATNTIVLPLVSDGTYDFYVNWGDGKEVEKITTASAATHEYATPGEYTIHIAGEIKGWRFFFDFTDQGDAAKLTDVTQWGSLSLGNTEGRQFQGAQNFNPTATDAPDLSETTSLTAAFTSASNFNADISDWNVGEVTTMNYMFNFATSFNNNGMVLDWDDKTSNVTNMNNMFNLASAFNQDISEWDVGKVATSEDFATGSGLELNNVPYKFRGLETVSREQCKVNPLINCFISVWNTENSGGGASATNTIVLPLVSGGTYDFYVDWGDGKEVEKITTDSAATHTYDAAGEKTIHIAGTIKGWRFYVEDDNYGDAVKLTDVSQWGSLSLGNTDGRQFRGAENFNPTATDAPDLSETTSLLSAFFGASNFNADISDWDVSQVTDMAYMFFNASSFNNNGKPLDWGSKTSKVEDMDNMFNGASAFNQDISGWKVEKVETSEDFADGSKLDDDNVPYKFRGANAVSKEVCEANPKLNCFISVWNTDNSGKGASFDSMVQLPLVEGGTYDFYVNWGDGTDVQKIEGYDDKKVAHTHKYDINEEYTIHIAGEIKGWRFFVERNKHGDAIKLLNVTQWGSLSLGNTDGSQFFGATNFNPTATDALDVSETTRLSNAFTGASSFNGEIGNWDVSQITDMNSMFQSASNFNQDISAWNVEKVTDMAYMFSGANSFNNKAAELKWGDKTSKVTDMKFMFANAKAFNQDISGWNVENVTTMKAMFHNAEAFNNKAAELKWGAKTSKVTDMIEMFSGAKAFNQDISAWDVGEVTSMKAMFKNAEAFNNKAAELKWGAKTSKVTDMTEMFSGAKAFNQDLRGWNVGKVEKYDNFATDSALIPNHTPSKFK